MGKFLDDKIIKSENEPKKLRKKKKITARAKCEASFLVKFP